MQPNTIGACFNVEVAARITGAFIASIENNGGVQKMREIRNLQSMPVVVTLPSRDEQNFLNLGRVAQLVGHHSCWSVGGKAGKNC